MDLCQKLICNYSEFDGRVLDNCMGEGIVGKAALRMGRQFVGIEKDVQKFRKACKEVHSVEYAEGICKLRNKVRGLDQACLKLVAVIELL